MLLAVVLRPEALPPEAAEIHTGPVNELPGILHWR